MSLELSKIRARYNIFPLEDSKENLLKIFNFLKNKDIPDKCLFKCSSDHANITFLALLMLQDKYIKMEKFNSYDFVDIYLQRHEGYLALSHIKLDAIGITNGYGEMPNAQLINMTRYIINRRDIKKFWFYQRGYDYKMESMLKEEGFYTLNLDALFGKSSKVPNSDYKYAGKNNSNYKHDFYSKDNLKPQKKGKFTGTNTTHEEFKDEQKKEKELAKSESTYSEIDLF